MDLRFFYATLYREAQTMAGRKLFCAKCGYGIVVDREVPAVCPNKQCGSSTWRCSSHPSKPYTLTEDDKAFLRVQRIDPDR
jgi:predicted RNA-binding Zn-ribbon protein involved in translation (DUF1610 family)